MADPSDLALAAATATGGATDDGLQPVSRQPTPTVDGRPPAPPHARLARGAAVGRYLVVAPLGAGGMGEVYAAYDPELDRRIALKLLRGGGGLDRRLLREARALARLSHPNVVAAYDVGTLDDGRVYLAMELVPGVTLHRWLHSGRRSVRQILEVFAQAGRGLGAGHRAGIVHRDFKPANVMVRPDGRVAVLDFGLARGGGGDAGSARAVVSLDRLGTSVAAGALDAGQAPLTRPGVALGTPAYMAPEQRRGDDAGPAADQYSFCVALHQALFGFLPPADGAGDAGGRRPTAERRRVPARLRPILLRGLAAAPGGRFPSMEALLAALARNPWRRWRRLAAASLLVAATAFAGLRAGRPAAPRCDGGDARLAVVWNPARARTLERAMTATGAPYAEAAWNAVRRSLDRYGDAWRTMRRDACRATHLRGEQSSQLLDRRMICLDRRLQEMAALIAVLHRDPATTAARAARAVEDLAALDACADSQALLATTAPPDDRLQAPIEALRQRLAEARAHQEAGLYQRGLTLAQQAVEQAEALGYWPLRAEARLRQGTLEALRSQPDAAHATLVRAVMAAGAGGHDRAAAEAYLRLVRVAGYQQADVERARRYAAHAEALIERLGQPRALRATLEDHLGMVAFQAGHQQQAEDHLRRALALHAAAGGAPRPALAHTISRLSNVLVERGALRDALALRRRALAMLEATVGPAHPETASALDQLGAVRFQLGELAAARRHLTRALAVKRAALGERHAKVAATLTHLGNLEATVGHPAAAAERFGEALRIYRATFGDRHPHVAIAAGNLGSSLWLAGDLDAAAARYAQALAIQERAHGADHPWVATTLYNLGALSLERGDPASALAHHRRALSIWRAAYGGRHDLVAQALTGIGRAQLAAGAPRAALAPLEQALTIVQGSERDPAEGAETRFALARALAESGGDRARARRLAERAAAILAAAPERYRDELARVRRWLAGQAPP